MVLCTLDSRYLTTLYKNGSMSLLQVLVSVVTSQLTAFTGGVHNIGSCSFQEVNGGHLLKFVDGVDGLMVSTYVFCAHS